MKEDTKTGGRGARNKKQQKMREKDTRTKRKLIRLKQPSERMSRAERRDK